MSNRIVGLRIFLRSGSSNSIFQECTHIFVLVSRGQVVFIPALMKRTHHCSQLRKSDAGSAATLVGWVDSVRDHGGILFVDLRDREGLTQIVLDPANATLEAQFGSIKPESVIEVTGNVQERIEAAVNTNLATGEIEVHASELMICLLYTSPSPRDRG